MMQHFSSLPPLRTGTSSSLYETTLAMDALEPSALNVAMQELGKQISSGSPMVSYAAALLVDCALAKWARHRDDFKWHSSVAPPTHLRVSMEKQVSDICCSVSMKDLSVYAYRVTQAQVKASPEDPWLPIFYKIHLRKCKIHHFKKMITLKVTDKKDTATSSMVAGVIFGIVQCSLLGNWPHCSAASRPGVTVRHMIYCLFGSERIQPCSTHESEATEHGRHLFLTKCREASAAFCTHLHQILWLLIAFSIREYEISVVEDNPALKRVMIEQFDYHTLRFAVLTAMDRVRSYVRMAILKGILTLDTAAQPHVGDVPKPYEAAILEILEEAQSGILSSVYHKPRSSLLTGIHATRLSIRPSLSWVPKGKRVELKAPDPMTGVFVYEDPNDDAITSLLKDDDDDDDDDDEEKKRKTRDEKKLEKLAPGVLDDLATAPLPQRRHTEPQSGDSIIVSLYCMQWDDTATVERIIGALDPCATEEKVIFDIIAGMPAVGIPLEAARQAYDLAVGHANGSEKKRAWKTTIGSIAVDHPYMYCYLVTAACMWKRHIKVRRFPLPANYRTNQLDAIAMERGLSVMPDTKATIPVSLPTWEIEIWFCRVCFEVYSTYRRHYTTRKKCYNVGWMDMNQDPYEGKSYCRRHRTSWREACFTTEVARVSIVGQILCIQTSAFLLCPQQRCGAPMLFEPHLGAYTSRGIACCYCTETIDRELEEATKLLHSSRTVSVLKCFVCSGRKAEMRPLDAFRYGAIHAACKVHHSADMAAYVDAEYPSRLVASPGSTPDSIILSLMFEYWTFNSGVRALRMRKTDIQRTKQDKQNREARMNRPRT